MGSRSLDTNVFNHILDGEIDIEQYNSDYEFYATHVQMDELDKTKDKDKDKDKDRRTKLIELFKRAEEEVTESAVHDTSRYGKAKYTENTLQKDILEKLNELKRKKNNIEDSLIADAAYKKGYILITNDRALQTVFEGIGGHWEDWRRINHN